MIGSLYLQFGINANDEMNEVTHLSPHFLTFAAAEFIFLSKSMAADTVSLTFAICVQAFAFAFRNIYRSQLVKALLGCRTALFVYLPLVLINKFSL